MIRGRVLMAYYPKGASSISNNPLSGTGTSSSPEPGYGFPSASPGSSFLYYGDPYTNTVIQYSTPNLSQINSVALGV